MKRLTLATSILLLVCFSANAQSEFDLGLVKDGTYINSGLGFSFKYPEGWTVHGNATNERIKEIGSQEMVDSGALSKPTLEASLKNSHYLLTAFRHPLGTPGIAFNPALLVLAERVDHAPGIKNGRDYLLNVRALLHKAGKQVPVEEPAEHRLAGWQFFRDSYSVEISGVQVFQTHFATISKAYALVFIFMAQDQKSLDEISKSMETFTAVPVRKELKVVVDTPPTPKSKPESKPN
jgi:hypothetical protein